MALAPCLPPPNYEGALTISSRGDLATWKNRYTSVTLSTCQTAVGILMRRAARAGLYTAASHLAALHGRRKSDVMPGDAKGVQACALHGGGRMDEDAVCMGVSKLSARLGAKEIKAAYTKL